jgi:hypothetical protein
MNDLLKQLLACKHFRWMRGMKVGNCTIQKVTSKYVIIDGGHEVPKDIMGLVYPLDMEDPATKGCLLALVREAWRCPAAFAYAVWTENSEIDYWKVECGDPPDRWICQGKTESEALIKALLAATKAVP